MVEGTPLNRKPVQSTGQYRDNLHACHVMDDLRQQHMTDSNRAENAYNKKMRGE
jgi:hypothetical protein